MNALLKNVLKSSNSFSEFLTRCTKNGWLAPISLRYGESSYNEVNDYRVRLEELEDFWKKELATRSVIFKR